MSEMPERLLSADEVAQRLAVDPATARRWLRSGRLPGIFVGGSWRVAPSDLATFIEAGTRRRVSRYADVEFAVTREPR